MKLQSMKTLFTPKTLLSAILVFSLLSCSSDDDNHNDDCNNCTTEQLEAVLITCSDWYIEDLELSNIDLESNYVGYFFNFFTDNTITVSWDENTANGTWTATGTGNNINVTFNIPDFDDINNTWRLDEIENINNTEVSFEISTNNDLEFKSNNCN
ncbi:hypothetical protein [Winogradskyella psychrotolerans]|uniref:hypothetical protein n=1 Tax=Winogradskyella psychrotolerans TaxID=1344585 RepID=UPI001C06845F|nr:hypothetical protein [Winogradskyella psychrotolerans]MBU2926671.1 hypothetical protein [Winogradskyella psychrotolerans]